MPRTVRRELLDSILARTTFPKKILDVGGKKEKQRGLFRYHESIDVTYLNIDTDTNPDICSDAINLPLSDESTDCIVIFEVLEHVEYPDKVLDEIERVLAHGGSLYLSMPFMVGIHADPYDFQRYTLIKLRHLLRERNLAILRIEEMGGLGAVIHDLIHQYLSKKNSILSKISIYSQIPDRRVINEC